MINPELRIPTYRKFHSSSQPIHIHIHLSIHNITSQIYIDEKFTSPQLTFPYPSAIQSSNTESTIANRQSYIFHHHCIQDHTRTITNVDYIMLIKCYYSIIYIRALAQTRLIKFYINDDDFINIIANFTYTYIKSLTTHLKSTQGEIPFFPIFQSTLSSPPPLLFLLFLIYFHSLSIKSSPKITIY